ncbi:MAG: DUF2124 family protein [Methanomassiliicoccales archaeon]
MEMSDYQGISGFTKGFREALEGLEGKAVFAGSVGVCTPFIELLAYSVRAQFQEMFYLPTGDPSRAKRMVQVDGVGFQVSEGTGDPGDPDAVVLLGGLAMPKFGSPVEDIQRMIEDLGGRPRIIGVGFNQVFSRTGWTDRIAFDVLMDTSLSTSMLSP